MGFVKNLDSANIYIKQERIALESGKVMTCYTRDLTVTRWLQWLGDETRQSINSHPIGDESPGTFLSQGGEIEDV